MDLLARMAEERYEQVVHCHDPATGLRAIVAIHSTALGPALGGTRFWPFTSSDEALADVLRLARAMTYKAAAAGLRLGGGKAVIVGDPRVSRTDDLIEAYAAFVDSLGGRYVTAEDVGTTQADMDLIGRFTRHVSGTSPELGGSGDPSLATAVGVQAAMEAVAEVVWGSADLGGRHVCVAGVGKVGYALARSLARAGARLTVADTDPLKVAAAVEHLGAQPVPPEAIHRVPCDVFAPCALGGALGGRVIFELEARAVCGSANNQLAADTDAARLADRGVLYAPDFVVNAGGLINISDELDGYDAERAMRRVRGIRSTTAEIIEMAAASGLTPLEAAIARAEHRLAAAAGPVAAAGR